MLVGGNERGAHGAGDILHLLAYGEILHGEVHRPFEGEKEKVEGHELVSSM